MAKAIQVLFNEERLTEWYKKGRKMKRDGQLSKHCRHGFQIVELTSIGFLQICCSALRAV